LSGTIEVAMSESWTHPVGPAPLAGARRDLDWNAVGRESPAMAQYALALALVVPAAVVAFVVEHLIAAPNLSLIFVLPVIVAASAFGWGPAMASVAASVLTFDFLFTRPYFSLRIASASDLWAAGLLLAIATGVSSLAAQSRQRAIAAQEAAEQAGALQGLAHLVIEGRPEWEIVRAAADALNRVFGAPAVICLRSGEDVAPVAGAGDPKLTEADREAALGALGAGLVSRAASYPYDKSRFDFWPLVTADGAGWAIGVEFPGARSERPASADRFIDIVRG
jgi:K+-sensing histidine kinase KdpD